MSGIQTITQEDAHMTEQYAPDNKSTIKNEESIINRVTLSQLRDKLVSEVKEYQNNDNIWFDVSDPAIVNLIMSTYGDKTNRQILACAKSSPNTIMGIISECKIPQTTAYSKMMGLIENEFLVRYDTIYKKSKQVNRYLSILRDIQISILGNQDVTIKIKFS